MSILTRPIPNTPTVTLDPPHTGRWTVTTPHGERLLVTAPDEQQARELVALEQRISRDQQTVCRCGRAFWGQRGAAMHAAHPAGQNSANGGLVSMTKVLDRYELDKPCRDAAVRSGSRILGIAR